MHNSQSQSASQIQEAAFARLYQQHSPAIFAYLCHRVDRYEDDDFNQQMSNFSREPFTPEERLLHDLRRTHHTEASAVTRSLENVWQRLQAPESRPDKQIFIPSSPRLHSKRANTREELLNMQTVEKKTQPSRQRYSWLTVLAAGLMVALLTGTALGAFFAFRQAHLHTASLAPSIVPTPQLSFATGKAITGLAWSPDGQFFASTDAQGTLEFGRFPSVSRMQSSGRSM